MAAPMTGAALEQAWHEMAEHFAHAYVHGASATAWMMMRVTFLGDDPEGSAACCAEQAAHHANRALDLLAHLTADGRKDE